jgi:hypothetical protein
VPPTQGTANRIIFGPVRQTNPCEAAGGLEGYYPMRVDDSGPSPLVNYAAWDTWHANFVSWCEGQKAKGQHDFVAVCYPLRNPSSGRPGYVCWCCTKCESK